MDDRFALDPSVLSLAKNELDLSASEMEKPIGRVTEGLSAKTAPGQPSQQEQLIGLAIKEALAQRRVAIDGVLHGSFSDEDIEPGAKTVADVWDLMPYENFLVTAELTGEELTAVLDEAFTAERNGRNLLGFSVQVTDAKKDPKVTALLDQAGRPLDPHKRHRIAFNSYDAQSGGQRLPRLKQLVASAPVRAAFHPVETRQAVIDLFLRHGEISPALLVPG